MILLAIETTGPRASVALVIPDKNDTLTKSAIALSAPVVEMSSDGKFNHLRDLIPMIGKLTEQKGIGIEEITHLAVSSGPGSFTGIRIGVSTARALAQALGVDVIKVPTLETFVYNDPDDAECDGRIVCPIFDARRNQMYAGAYIKKEKDIITVVPGDAYYPNDFLGRLTNSITGLEDKRPLFFGDGAEVFRNEIERAGFAFDLGDDHLQSAGSVARWALSHIDETIPYAGLEPVYMRQAEAQRKFDESRMLEKLTIREATEEDIDTMTEIDALAFTDPWRREEFESEIAENAIARYLIAEVDGRVIAYAGLWSIVDEGHITNIAVLDEYRRKGVARALTEHLMRWTGEEDGLIKYTLEVRVSNAGAVKLYSSLGFEQRGVREKYYRDGEDAVIMWKEK